jgi:CRISPR-associated protein (TIGR03986 family)
MNPKHIYKVPDERKAIAPYNFIELPEKVVTVSPESLPKENCYYSPQENRYTGKIECTLTTESPLYIRCGLTTEEFECGVEAKDLPDFFYTNPLEKATKPVIPGTSLKGMLRNFVEIVSFSKIERVSNNQRLFFRAVAANPAQDSLGKAYKQYINPKNIKAGYLKKDSEGWYIQPAKIIVGKTFALVKEKHLNLKNLKRFNDDEYHPQYISVSYETLDNTSDRTRLFALNVDLPGKYHNQGVLVTSGNMKQGNDPSPRRNHCIVFEENSTSSRLRLDDKAIEHYRNALTDFQKKSPFDNNWGMLNENCSVLFYYPPENGNKVGFFGQSPNFRIPYSPRGDGHATTVEDFIPRDLNNTSIIDLADAIFGWVKKDKELPEDMRQRASRVFITDAQYKCHQNGLWYKGNPDDTVTPPILSEPKPTCFQHYLVQPDNTKADKSKLKHYASQPESETVIRGHKLYWHKGSNPDIQNPNPNAHDTQTTQIKPINKGVSFEFIIYFENLSNVELGALLWVLSLSSNKSETLGTGKPGEKYCFSLGMGKPLGMGAVKISYKLHLSDRTSRYRYLFHNSKWKTGEEINTEIAKQESSCVKAFTDFMLDPHKGINNKDRPKEIKVTSLNEIRRIEMLLAMLRYDQTPDKSLTRYMTIEAKEYQNRPVLPDPIQVIRDDKLKSNDSTSGESAGNSGNSTNTPKPKPKGSDVGMPIKKYKQSQQKPQGNSEGGNFDVLARPPKPKS